MALAKRDPGDSPAVPLALSTDPLSKPFILNALRSALRFLSLRISCDLSRVFVTHYAVDGATRAKMC